MQNDGVFNPLDKRNLGKSVVDALLEGHERSLGAIEPFTGAGIYAIYYRGEFKPYAALAKLNQESGTHPIYVGKAIPKGARKGSAILTSLRSRVLFTRLREHAGSIATVPSLAIEDFTYRCLAVDDIWITLGETLVIERFQPLWNNVVEGFGNHDPGSGRYRGKRPLWDELHPGRGWALKCAAPKLTSAQILKAVSDYIAKLAPPA